MDLSSIHSAEDCHVLDSLSAMVFFMPGRCSANRVIPRCRHHCHRSQASCDRVWDCVPPILLIYEIAVVLSILRMEDVDVSSVFCKSLRSQDSTS